MRNTMTDGSKLVYWFIVTLRTVLVIKNKNVDIKFSVKDVFLE